MTTTTTSFFYPTNSVHKAIFFRHAHGYKNLAQITCAATNDNIIMEVEYESVGRNQNGVWIESVIEIRKKIQGSSGPLPLKL